eukprot:TRINITY_DN67912_c0_g1_i1.p2 TRINITY_DN67912_c0_g1~~TRINITY_DN67912_c0_g1_i1.p2  ORF type:complete len:261 (+),score=40.99 TRINITY_DN67912_c0_g1_i1:65-784(+)
MDRGGHYYDVPQTHLPNVAECEVSPPISLEMEKGVVNIQALARGVRTRAGISSAKSLSHEQSEKLVAAQHESNARRVFLKDVHERLGLDKTFYNSSKSMQQAHDYLERHNIPQLLEGLMAQSALERPEDLREFLIDVLTEMKNNQSKPSMGPFTEEDIETMFHMWDQLQSGLVPVSNVLEQLRALHIEEPQLQRVVMESLCLESLEEEQLTLEVDKPTFMAIIRSELQRMFSAATFCTI